MAVSAVAAAVPLGLNRPVFWLGFGILVAGWALVYLSLAQRYQFDRALAVSRLSGLFALAAAVPVWALLQALPLAEIAPAIGPEAISILPSASLMGAIRFTIYILFFFLVIETAGRTVRATRIGWFVFWGIVAHAVWGLLALNVLGDIHFWGEKLAYNGSATGTFINRNSFATFLGMGGCLGLALILGRDTARTRPVAAHAFSERKLETLATWIGLVTIWIALFGTQSRLGVGAAAIGAGVCFAAFRIKNGAPALRVFGGVAFIGIVALVGAAVLLGQGLIGRTVFLEGSIEARLSAYRYTLELIAARPWFGHGLDAFRPAFETVHRPPLPGKFYWDRAHSTYLSHWVELGIVVGTIPLIMGGVVAGRLIKELRRRDCNFSLCIAGLGALATGAVHSLADFSLEIPANVILLLTILGLGLANRCRVSPGVGRAGP